MIVRGSAGSITKGPDGKQVLIMLYTVSEIADKNDRIEHLIAEIAKGNKDALGDLYSLIKTDVFAYAMSKTGNKPDAEDIMQDTFIQIYKYAGRYEPQGKPMAWIVTIVLNLVRRQGVLKSRHMSLDESVELESETVESPATDVLRNEWLKWVMKALNDEEREVIVLHIVSGLRHREIAELKGEPLSTVLSRYNRAIKKLQKYAKEESE